MMSIFGSYGCTKIPPLFFKGCCNGFHDSFGSRPSLAGCSLTISI
nr:MAG TPA: hypothetical protein [Caudoviricetes sp.]